MKLLTILLAAMAGLSTTAYAQVPDSLDSAAENRIFAEEFIRHARHYKCNVAGCNDTTGAIYTLYRDLSDEQMLLDRGIIHSYRAGRYVTPQTTVDFGVLPADSTLNTVRELLETSSDSLTAQSPRGTLLRGLLDTLVPFRADMQKAFRKTVGYRIVTFYPETIYPADSVIYINKELLKRIEEFSKKGLTASSAVGRERNDFLTAEFSVKSSMWVPYVHWIDRPITLTAVILENNLRRAFVSALAGGTQGWGLLLELDAQGHWQIVAAKVLYHAAQS